MKEEQKESGKEGKKISGKVKKSRKEDKWKGEKVENKISGNVEKEKRR